MKELKQETIEQRIRYFIKKIKFLSNIKYYKNNRVSCAAYDSWAARGQAGGCRICNSNCYNYTLHNNRNTGKHKHWHFNEFGKICSRCYTELEKQCNYKFKKY